MRISVIDIGTNTLLMLIADYDKMTSSILTLKDIQNIPRIGKGVDANKNIPQESIDKAITILNEYKQVCTNNDVQMILPVATSFLRDANNKVEFIEKVKSGTGLDIEILSGETEARWAFWGAVYEMIQDDNPDENVPRKTKHPVVTIDIGGGSTEISCSDSLPNNFNRQILMSRNIVGKSFDVGSVRIRERYMSRQPADVELIQSAELFINNCFNDLNINLQNAELVGVAGTITTLGAISQGNDIFNAELINGLYLSIEEIDMIYDNLIDKKIEAILKIGNYMEGRADIIVPGILILRTFMKKFGFRRIRVSTKGLRYGIFLRETAV
jgi:exopolyphosphatase/guanosine-5'-triphosphate,3'-diphosphate pyrophosphatase